MNNYLVTIIDTGGDYDFFIIVAEDRNHAWEVANSLFFKLTKITSGDYYYLHNVELIWNTLDGATGHN